MKFFKWSSNKDTSEPDHLWIYDGFPFSNLFLQSSGPRLIEAAPSSVSKARETWLGTASTTSMLRLRHVQGLLSVFVAVPMLSQPYSLSCLYYCMCTVVVHILHILHPNNRLDFRNLQETAHHRLLYLMDHNSVSIWSPPIQSVHVIVYSSSTSLLPQCTFPRLSHHQNCAIQ